MRSTAINLVSRYRPASGRAGPQALDLTVSLWWSSLPFFFCQPQPEASHATRNKLP